MPFYNQQDPKSLEKYSAAVTLSDLEIFVFPELLYSLVLANIMSPTIWSFKNNDWFQRSAKLSTQKKILRLRQFIMDNFTFNLDLETWGLTQQELELERFKDIIDVNQLKNSNALFGYTGDKYYFDLNIRKHFGLDKYDDNVIPYWKTETVEAMEAFKYKPEFHNGAGECVSLSALYAAMLHVCIGIPLEDIFLLATPLHSQNFINYKEGILTNNRRLVTKSMWFNGTEISAKARRALENEQITIVANNTGYIHYLYPEASIDERTYQDLVNNLGKYLCTGVDSEVLSAFLRYYKKYQSCFQIERIYLGKKYYIEAEKAYSYENHSNSKLGDRSQSALLKEIEIDEFYPKPIVGKAIFNHLQELLQHEEISTCSQESIKRLKPQLPELCLDLEDFLKDLSSFCYTKVKLPSQAKVFKNSNKIDLSNCQSREDVVAYLKSIKSINPVADLAFMAARDMQNSPWKPFLKAAFERNPVSLELNNLDLNSIFEKINSMPNTSIYEETRLAQPDEVYNFQRGDGLEKSILFLNLLIHRKEAIKLKTDQNKIIISANNANYEFKTDKYALDLLAFEKESSDYI